MAKQWLVLRRAKNGTTHLPTDSEDQKLKVLETFYAAQHLPLILNHAELVLLSTPNTST